MIWEISATDEKELDYYEGFLIQYTKDFFKLNEEKVMFYIMKRKHLFKSFQKKNLNIIDQGYKDCNLNRGYLNRRLKFYNIKL